MRSDSVDIISGVGSLLVRLRCTVLSIYSYYYVTTFGDEGSSRMAHVAFGHILEFDPYVKGISSYLERVGLYFDAKRIESERQVAVFLSLIGGTNYALFRVVAAAAT